MPRWPRALLVVGSFTLAWTLACSGLTDRIKGAVADQVAGVLADAIGVPRDQVSITPLDSGRFAVDTPDWDANCGMGPQSKMPKSFALKTGAELMGDCKIDASCKQVLGIPCDTDLGLALLVYNDGTPAKKLVSKRTKELEGKGWTVTETRDDKNKDATVLTATEGKKARAVAVISQSDGGSAAEILIAPL
jgi:hypothetical protein